MAYEDSPARILYNEDGYAIGVIDDTVDAAVKRLQTETRFAPNQVLNVTQSLLPADLANFVQDKLRNPLDDSPEMVVDGSSTPVEFIFNADGYSDLLLFEVRIVMSSKAIDFTGDKFANLDTLPVGIVLEVRSGGVTTEIFVIDRNENFLELISPGGVFLDKQSTDDTIAVGLNFGANVRLVAGSDDFVKMTINDNLIAAGANAIDYLRATQWAIKV